MKHLLLAGLVGLALAACSQAQDYFPAAGDAEWERREPASQGFDAPALQAAIDFAISNETRAPEAWGEGVDIRDLELVVPLTWGYEPHSSPIGELRPRGAPAGIIIRHGYIVAEWGDLDRVDMTFSGGPRAF